jgi:hypothetical protein
VGTQLIPESYHQGHGLGGCPQQTNVRRFVLFPLLLNKVTSHYTQSNNLRIVSAPPGTVTQTCVSKFGARIQKKGGVKL